MSRTEAQAKALALAKEHHYVVIGKGYGRDVFKPNAIAAGTWKRLVLDGLLTPNTSGGPFMGEALRVESGCIGYLTQAGREALAAEARAARIPPAGAARNVFAAIRIHSKRGVCGASRSQLAKYTALHESAVDRALTRLEKLGLIVCAEGKPIALAPDALTPAPFMPEGSR